MSLLTFDPRSERIRLANRRLAAAYAREPGVEAPIVDPGVSAPVPGYAATQMLDDLEKMLVSSASWANGLAATDNDWPPVINTLCGVVMVAEAFGCEVVYGGGEVAWTKPAITDINQVWNLKPLKVGESPLIRRLAEWIDYAQRRLGAEVPFWTMDIQSPFSVAAHIVEPMEWLSACSTAPAAVHHLCRMVTEFTIEMMQRHIAQMERPGFPGRNFPSISERIGVCIADDTPLIMLSAEMYRELALPYNCQLGEVFGGIHIHSCGDYRHNLLNLLQITNIRSIQLHAGPGEFPLPASAGEDHAFNRARKQLTCLVDANPVSRGDDYRGKAREFYAEYVLPRLCADDLTGCIVQSCGKGPDLPDADAAIRWTRAQLITRCAAAAK